MKLKTPEMIFYPSSFLLSLGICLDHLRRLDLSLCDWEKRSVLAFVFHSIPESVDPMSTREGGSNRAKQLSRHLFLASDNVTLLY